MHVSLLTTFCTILRGKQCLIPWMKNYLQAHKCYITNKCTIWATLRRERLWLQQLKVSRRRADSAKAAHLCSLCLFTSKVAYLGQVPQAVEGVQECEQKQHNLPELGLWWCTAHQPPFINQSKPRVWPQSQGAGIDTLPFNRRNCKAQSEEISHTVWRETQKQVLCHKTQRESGFKRWDLDFCFHCSILSNHFNPAGIHLFNLISICFDYLWARLGARPDSLNSSNNFLLRLNSGLRTFTVSLLIIPVQMGT